MAKKAVSIKDIANRLGLSRTTVSYVLRGKHEDVNIAKETSELVLETAREMGYRTNFWARSLVSQKSKLIGVLFPDITGSAAHQITCGIQEELGQSDYEAILAVNFWNQEKERREVERMQEKCIDGLIVLPQPGSVKIYQELIKAECPLVFLGDYLPEIPASSVTLDPVDAVTKILEHMYEQGCRKFKLLSVDYLSATLLEREKAFKAGVKRLGCKFKSEDVLYAKLADEASVHEQARKVMQGKDRPDGLLCISDALAFQALAEFARMGVAIPQDLMVAGICNLYFSDHPFFSLTTMDECREEMGRLAARVMLRQIQAEDSQAKPEHVRLKGELIIRRSTDAARKI